MSPAPVDAGSIRDGNKDVQLVSPGRDAPGPVDMPPRDAEPDRRLPPDVVERCDYRGVRFRHPQVVLALDRSTSMQERPTNGSASRLHGVQHVLETLIRKYNRAVHFGYVEFPVADCPAGACCASRVLAPTREILMSITRRWSCENEPPSCVNTTRDSPVAEALSAIRRMYDLSTNVSDKRHAFLMTDGEPACSVSTMDDQCLRSGTEAGRLLSEEEASTTVFALSDALRSSACLADVAGQGGTMAPVFAPTNEVLKEKLEEKIGPLAKEACTFRLNTPLDPTERLEIWVNNSAVKRDPSRMEGWEFDSAAPNTVTFYGTWCTKFSTSQVTSYEVQACGPR